MTVLTRKVAQDIVDQTMKILERNINVMDETGIIIGSGESSRIGKMHEGAAKVIQQKVRFDIAMSEDPILTGTKPGINLPIAFENKVVGVVGISGDPKEISQFGELVKITAEMILKQTSLTEQLQWDVKLREELVNQMIHNKVDTLSIERAKRLDMDLTLRRIPILIELITMNMEEHAISQLKKNTLSYLHDHLKETDLVASVGPNQIIILKEYQSHDGKQQIIRTIKEWIDMRSQNQSFNLRAAIGTEYMKLEDVQTAYRYAEDALKVGKALYPDNYIYDQEELLLPILLSQFNLKENKLTQYYHTLVDYDKRGELQATLQMYIDQNGELNQTAKKLYIHRNTLSYRLEKILEVTGRDPRKTNDLLKLHISQLLYQLK